MAVMAASELKNADQAAFEAQAGRVLQEVRGAMAGVIAAIPGAGALSGGGGEIRTATDLQRILGIRKTLAWQIFRIAYAADPLAEGGKVPGKGAMQRFFDAATAQGVPAKPIESASAALEAFDDLVRTHAGDRASFASLISGVASEGGEQANLQYKRMAFRGNTHLWGVQAKAQLQCMILHPAADPELFDVALVLGYVGLQRSRSASRLVLWRTSFGDSDYEAFGPSFAREPLEGGPGAQHGVSLLSSFCSQPLPELCITEHEPKIVQTELVGNGIGRTSAVTIIHGQVLRNVTSMYSDDTPPSLSSDARIRLPAEVLVHDVLIHEDFVGLTSSLTPEVFVSGGNHWDVPSTPESDQANRLDLRESAVYLGKGLSVLHTPDVPRLAEMVEYTCEQLGWDVNRFDAYRCRVQYPVMPSKVTMRFELPERGTL